MQVKAVSKAEIDKMLDKASYGFISFVDVDKPYTIPMAHVYKDNLYFLMLKEGRKTECLKKNKNVCFLVYLVEGDKYTSVLLEGTMEKVTNNEELKSILSIFCKRMNLPAKKCNEIIELSKHPVIGLYKLVVKAKGGIKKV
jgi:nitroimidazol reductase NimA-like FMN-containing flavoprotein (pyridoxamine 5'-phosphate oxidase superfamily)